MSRASLMWLSTALAVGAVACSMDDQTALRFPVEREGSQDTVPFTISLADEVTKQDESRKLFLRFDRADAWERDTRAWMSGYGGTWIWYLPPGEYLVELVDDRDDVVLSVPSVKVAPKILNNLVVYGDAKGLRHDYVTMDPSEVPAGKVRYYTGNFSHVDEAARFELCTKAAPGEARECTLLRERVEYGEATKVDFLEYFSKEQSVRVTLLGSGESYIIDHGPFKKPDLEIPNRTPKTFALHRLKGIGDCDSCFRLTGISDEYWFRPWE